MRCPRCGIDAPDLKFCDLCGSATGASVALADKPGAGSLGSAAPAKPAGNLSPAQAAKQEALDLLRRGNYEAAFERLQIIVPLPEGDRPLHNALRIVIQNRRTAGVFSAGHTYMDRMEAASRLSEAGYHEEALGVLTQEAIDIAARGEESFTVASIYAKAGKADEFAAKAARRKNAEFYSAYARAFDMVDKPAAALALLNHMAALRPDDYALLFALRRKLGTLDAIEPGGLPDEQKPRYAQALIEDGKEAAALKGLRDAVAACLKADPAARPKDARAVEKLLAEGA